MHGDFLWDDDYLVRENPFFKSPVFALEVFRHWLFLDSFSVYYRPVQNLSYMADYWLWNANPFGYHFTNILLHACGGCLLFCVLARVLPGILGPERRSRKASFFVAWIWVVHPIHNAAVAYVAGRADSLAALFSLLAWLAYLEGRAASGRAARIGFLALAPVCALLGLCSKEIALVWLGLFVLSLLFERPRRSLLAPLLGITAVVGAYYALRHLPAPRTPISEASGDSFAARVLLMLRALGDYTSLLLFPDGLRMERVVFSPQAYKSLAGWQRSIRSEYLSLIGSATLFCFAWLSFKNPPGRRLRLFGALWFLIGFLPISNLFPLNAQVAEHWIYIPSIGFLLFAAGCAAALPLRYQTAAAGLAAAACVALGVRTAFRSAEWADPEAFYSHMLAEDAASPRIYTNLAFIYSRRKDYPRAIAVLREGVEKYPGFVPARINLGINLAESGRKEEAGKFLSYARPDAAATAARFPRTWPASIAMARLRAEENNPGEALAILDEAIARNAEVWDLVKAKAGLLKPADAATLVQKYADAHWWHYDSFMELGRIRMARNENGSALLSLRHAGMLDIHSAEPFNLMAVADLREKKPADAYAAEMTAIRRNPDEPAQYVMLSAILGRLGREDDAREASRHARELGKD